MREQAVVLGARRERRSEHEGRLGASAGELLRLSGEQAVGGEVHDAVAVERRVLEGRFRCGAAGEELARRRTQALRHAFQLVGRVRQRTQGANGIDIGETRAEQRRERGCGVAREACEAGAGNPAVSAAGLRAGRRHGDLRAARPAGERRIADAEVGFGRGLGPAREAQGAKARDGGQHRDRLARAEPCRLAVAGR